MSDVISIILPARNEAVPIAQTLDGVRSRFPGAEVIVVDDGSSDDTAAVAAAHGAQVVSHPYSLGNGAAIKAGTRAAIGSVLIFMDADGQHRPEDIQPLLTMLDSGYDMVIGSRNSKGHASPFRRIANWIYNRLASVIVGHPILDLTSGMRAVRADKFKEILSLLPNGFSYPTTSTMAFFRLGYRVGYQPITVLRREGKSHIRLLQDGFRFLLIIIKIGTLYSPLKLFVPLSASFFTAGVGYYAFTYLVAERFTNMSAFLLTSAVVFFLFGLLSEQITTLMYAHGTQRKHNDG